jgi:integrase
LQIHLNGLAKRYSYCIAQHTHSFIRSIFEEALESNLLQKNPARSLRIPRVDQERVLGIGEQFFLNGKPFLTLDQLRSLLTVSRARDRLVVMLGSLCAMRPGEIFGLDCSAYAGDNLFILRRVYRGQIGFPKTEASRAVLPVPNVVREPLGKWKAPRAPVEQQGFVFNSRNGTPVHKDNFLRRLLQPAGLMAEIPFPVTFQVLRRTWATLTPEFGAGLKEYRMRAATRSFPQLHGGNIPAGCEGEDS